MFLAPRERESTIDPVAPQAGPAWRPAPASRQAAMSPPRKGPWLQVFAPYRFEWNRYELAIEDLPHPLIGLRIVHLSDLHLRPYWTSAYDELIHRLAEAPPDLLLFTGDFVEAKRNHLPVLPVVRRLASRLTARLGTFAISGNHDGDLLAPHLDDLDMTFLDGRCATIRLPNSPSMEGPGEGEPRGAPPFARIELIGLPGPFRDDFHPALLHRIGPRAPGVPRIVLSHYPDLIHHVRSLDADLFLTGHTHGGQICLPGGRALVTHDTLPRHLCKGIHRIGRTQMVINRGFGFATIPVRLFCPAEIIELVLRR